MPRLPKDLVWGSDQGARLRSIRLRRGMSREGVEQREGIGASLVWRHETGRTMPTEKTRMRYAQLYGVDVVELERWLFDGGQRP